MNSRKPKVKEVNPNHEQFMKDCFGDGFWDLPEDERFKRALDRMMGRKVETITREGAAEFNAREHRES